MKQTRLDRNEHNTARAATLGSRHRLSETGLIKT